MTVIATRILKIAGASGDVDVPVRIFAPVEEAAKAWKCEFEIAFPEGPKQRAGWGVDSVQALIHALWMIGIILYTCGPHEDGTLYFDKPGDGYGFPVVGSNRDILVGNDAKYF